MADNSGLDANNTGYPFTRDICLVPEYWWYLHRHKEGTRETSHLEEKKSGGKGRG